MIIWRIVIGTSDFGHGMPFMIVSYFAVGSRKCRRRIHNLARYSYSHGAAIA